MTAARQLLERRYVEMDEDVFFTFCAWAERAGFHIVEHPKVAGQLVVKDLPRGHIVAVPQLSYTQFQALFAIAKGMSNPDIARKLGVRLETVRERITALFRNLEVNDRAAAVDTAWRLGILGYER
ncbi:LuxR C-terminal-related transcriptional regulator [Amycolatopsis sp. NPDC006131]|uniref:response regulator transcription factor n=1 Tax=Amycolatopsis sp. NPDC006131 TaxID=3156731 RepID=UPI0033AC6392